jgi:glycosyltransferase 2 family protein
VTQKDLQHDFDEDQQEVLNSIRVSRIIIPILIGLTVVGYLFWKQYDPEKFAEIDWNSHTTFWIGISLILLIIRHAAYAKRLRTLSEGEFSWRKCIELIFIWEFSSAVSPTSLGGSFVALFVLSQEKLSAAKTTTIVIYSAILDTIFFVGTLPIFILMLGPAIIRPKMTHFYDIDGWGFTFLGAYSLMVAYGFAFFYGIFINPRPIKKIVVSATRLKWFRKYRHKAITLGNDIIVVSKEMKLKKWTFHLSAFLSTATAWSCRFLLLNCLIIAFVPSTPTDFISQFKLYSRLETMFVIMAFSPTPGGVGIAEATFGGFVTDYITNTNLVLTVAVIWRLITYYSYLLIGTIIIPNWIRNRLNERKLRRLLKDSETENLQSIGDQ